MNQRIQLINIDENPIILFNKWFEEAKQTEINDPNAMNLATVASDQSPRSRIVLLKYYDEFGFVFYTNLESVKANNIRENQKVALNFHWKSLTRQVRIVGLADLVKNKEADKYFDSRPENSRIGAWASKQSSELKKREELLEKVNDYKKKFEGKKILRPPNWSGYRVVPNLIEFWQEMPFRLHDRVEFNISEKGWRGRRLYP